MTIKAREAEAKVYENLIREAFEFEALIFTEATVEGQPNPDKDMWVVRAEIVPNTFIIFKISPKTDRGQAVLAMLSAKATDGTGWESTMREALGDLEEAKVWISRAWMRLNPDHPDVLEIRATEAGNTLDFTDW